MTAHDTAALLIRVGGLFHIAFFVFHIFFWRLFRWRADLRSLSFLNRNVMQILNLCLMAVFLGFAALSFAFTTDLLHTNLGHFLLLIIAVMWFLRAIEQVWFFGIRHPGSLAFFLVFLLGSALYAVPYVMQM